MTESMLILGGLVIAIGIVLIWAIFKITALAKLVDRLSQQIPGTGMTAKELADELGGSIESAFQQYVPKPDALAAALSDAVQAAGRQQVEEAEKVATSIREASATVKTGFAEVGATVAVPVEEARKALEGVAEAIQKSVTGASEQLQAALGGHAAEVQNALQGVGGQWSDQLTGVLGEHARKVTEANQVLGAQLEKIAALEQQIEQVLHVQETVEGTIKELAASQEFKDTLTELRTHLRESDKLLREAAKPRTIRLVESDGEVAQD